MLLLRVSSFVVIFISWNFNGATAAVSKRNPVASDAISYPGPTKKHKITVGDDGLPTACRGQKFCTIKPADFPEEKFNKLFEGYKPPIPDINIQPELIINPDLGNRQGDPDVMDECLSEVTYTPIYTVESKRGERLKVVQAPKFNYTQKARLERCLNVGARCFKVFAQSNDYTTVCKQKYNTWDLLVETPDGSIRKEPAELPVCCSCHYQSIDNLVSRFGKPKEMAMTPVKEKREV